MKSPHEKLRNFSSWMTRVACGLLVLHWTNMAAAQAPSNAGAAPAAPTASPQAPACPSVIKHTLPRLQDEKPVDLCQYAGKVLLVVNTASKCGFTPQYEGLEALYKKYSSKGLVVLGFPSGDFGGQELARNSDIAAFCQDTYAVKFPMFVKSQVVAKTGGGPVNPVFAELAQRTGKAPSWNFHKYLISRDGREVATWSSLVDPQDPKLLRTLEKYLEQNVN